MIVPRLIITVGGFVYRSLTLWITESAFHCHESFTRSRSVILYPIDHQ